MRWRRLWQTQAAHRPLRRTVASCSSSAFPRAPVPCVSEPRRPRCPPSGAARLARRECTHLALDTPRAQCSVCAVLACTKNLMVGAVLACRVRIERDRAARREHAIGRVIVNVDGDFLAEARAAPRHAQRVGIARFVRAWSCPSSDASGRRWYRCTSTMGARPQVFAGVFEAMRCVLSSDTADCPLDYPPPPTFPTFPAFPPLPPPPSAHCAHPVLSRQKCRRSSKGTPIGPLCACARVGGPQLGRETGAETIAQLEVLYGEGKRAGAESKLLAFPRWRYARQSSRFATPCTAHSSGTEHYGGRGHRRRRRRRRRRRLQPHVPFAGLRRAAAAVRRLADRGPGRAPHRSTSELELPTGRSVNAAVTGRR